MIPGDGAGEWLLAIRIRQFGDVLLTLEALRALKAYDPARRIAYVADREYHSILEGLDFIDRLLPAPPTSGPHAYLRYVSTLRRLRPRWVLDFHGSARSALAARLSGAQERIGFAVRARRRAYNVVVPRARRVDGRVVPMTSIEAALSLAARAGAASSPGAPPEIPVADDDIARGHNLLAQAGVPADALASSSVVGINPGRPLEVKSWPAEHWVRLAQTLVARGRHVVVMAGPGEEAGAESIARAAGTGVLVAPAVELGRLPGVLKALSRLVTIDSGLKHLAVCVRVPTVTLFGGTSPQEWHMATDADRYLWKGLSCSPCGRLDCPLGAPCMAHDPDEVLEAIERQGVGE